MTIPPDTMELLKKFGKAFNAADIAGILDCVTDDFEWVMARGPQPPHGRIVRGKDAMAAALAERSRELSGMRFSETEVFAAGDRVIGTFRATATRADGTWFDVRGCDIYVIRDGKIARKDSYWKQIE
ncbi:MAG: nuclear transport factor 2 family protein [Betaproteobacteria bacterium]|nr:nuclear transport factor 2 family protein [Betaproteobacteria bacterium]MBI3935676.1 nuclear transport factor 2 family protein [Betaproteobacteria bacterium]